MDEDIKERTLLWAMYIKENPNLFYMGLLRSPDEFIDQERVMQSKNDLKRAFKQAPMKDLLRLVKKAPKDITDIKKYFDRDFRDDFQKFQTKLFTYLEDGELSQLEKNNLWFDLKRDGFSDEEITKLYKVIALKEEKISTAIQENQLKQNIMQNRDYRWEQQFERVEELLGAMVNRDNQRPERGQELGGMLDMIGEVQDSVQTQQTVLEMMQERIPIESGFLQNPARPQHIDNNQFAQWERQEHAGSFGIEEQAYTPSVQSIQQQQIEQLNIGTQTQQLQIESGVQTMDLPKYDGDGDVQMIKQQKDDKEEEKEIDRDVAQPGKINSKNLIRKHQITQLITKPVEQMNSIEKEQLRYIKEFKPKLSGKGRLEVLKEDHVEYLQNKPTKDKIVEIAKELTMDYVQKRGKEVAINSLVDYLVSRFKSEDQ